MDIYIVVDVAAAKKKHVAIKTRISGLTRQSAVSILVRTRMYFAEMNDITDVHNVYETRRQWSQIEVVIKVLRTHTSNDRPFRSLDTPMK